MSPASPRESTQRNRGMLDLTVISETALKIIDRDGLDALTMRGLAAELGSSVNTLYWYARTKDEILDAVGELVIAEVEIPTAGRWDARLASVMRGIRDLLLAHPGIGSVGVNRPTSGPASLRLTDAILGLLRDGGLSEQRAFIAMRILTGFVYGFTAMGSAYASEDARHYRTQIRGADRDQYAHLAAVGTHLEVENSAEGFDLGLETLIKGLCPR